MYITTTEITATQNGQNGVIRYLPRNLRRKMYGVNLDEAQEIHMRLQKPLSIYFPDGCRYISPRGNLTAMPNCALRVTRADIDEAVELATASSVYSLKDEIRNGFVTLKGGHRVGITGTAILKGGSVEFIRDISALCYRLAREVKDAANPIMPYICGDDGQVRSTLIISPPAAGKTTMLRDIARQLSYRGKRVGIVDERREIAALHEGKSAFDLGFNTDVLEGADKAEGMLMVLRSMSPEVIITDELGKKADIDAVFRIICSGAAVIASVHGKDARMIRRRKDLDALLDMFEVVITMSRANGAGTVEEVLTR